MRKVLVFGTFDGLHQGHLCFFKQAGKKGDYLIVVVARDITVKKVKNHLPIRNEKRRLKEVQQCKLVNEAILGHKNNPYRIIEEINPDVICLGYDQKTFTKDLSKELRKMGLKTKIYRMNSYKPKKLHSMFINKNERGKNFN
ncbi:MAG: FAD synthase [Candidatus Nealsonbacteria bacterium CG_4_10_14_0_2_um_filter_38_17]|uniref:FAD synthase n=2 Tax=Candidatus Nealsoniibacteriota TaxID=1817911 RepID=A0A2M7UYY2_9BACT|nr:MAG: FAD synthase [Candidatus Nealsonbacteria bacterium CG23_combo_of_CG06-09_8_20_14_all_38_19]PIZ89179.1 MAG: FAD synthase [Candidatus Nealsonbacteria bacterium CG_4_10_14_0_2_um_filter_38_17]